MWLVGKRKTHLGKYFNCLLRFGAHHKRSICAPRSRVKGGTQMVLRTKQWKLIHELGKVRPVYLTIYLLRVCAAYRPVRTLLPLRMGGGLIVQIDLQPWRRIHFAPKENWIFRAARKLSNEYLSLFIFARFRYFSVSSPLLLWVCATRGTILRHATPAAREGCLCKQFT